jgi:hypothetical protein
MNHSSDSTPSNKMTPSASIGGGSNDSRENKTTDSRALSLSLSHTHTHAHTKITRKSLAVSTVRIPAATPTVNASHPLRGSHYTSPELCYCLLHSLEQQCTTVTEGPACFSTWIAQNSAAIRGALYIRDITSREPTDRVFGGRSCEIWVDSVRLGRYWRRFTHGGLDVRGGI